jgi:hypothetical protein
MSVLRVRGELPLPVSPERAWEVFSRVEDWPRWDWMGSRDARWLSGEPWTLGAVIRVGHRPFTFDGVITVADPPREVVWEAGGAGIQGHHSWRFVPHGDGCLIQSVETFRGPGARLLRPLVRWYWGRQMRSFRRFVARGSV